MNPMKTDSYSLIYEEHKFVQIIYLKVSILPEWVLIERTGSGSMYSHPDYFKIDFFLVRGRVAEGGG